MKTAMTQLTEMSQIFYMPNCLGARIKSARKDLIIRGKLTRLLLWIAENKIIRILAFTAPTALTKLILRLRVKVSIHKRIFKTLGHLVAMEHLVMMRINENTQPGIVID